MALIIKFPGFRWSAFSVTSGEPSSYECVRGMGNVAVLHIPRNRTVRCSGDKSLAGESGETKQPEQSPCVVSMTLDGLPRCDKLSVHNLNYYHTIKLYLDKQTMGLDGVELDFLRDVGFRFGLRKDLPAHKLAAGEISNCQQLRTFVHCCCEKG